MGKIIRHSLLLVAVDLAAAQHYCWPCAAAHGVIGKDTHAATDAVKCYDFFLRYLNNVAPNAQNTGNGVHAFKHTLAGPVQEGWDVFPNVIAAEFNECGTLAGDFEVGIFGGMTPEDEALVDKGMRLPTGDLHQCPCAVMGRAHIINGTIADVYDWAAVEESWGKTYTEKARTSAEATRKNIALAVDSVEFSQFNEGAVFGVHSVYCPFHASGPCKLRDVERRIAAAWSGNFSGGYVPLMDNNMLFWTATLGPLLDALLRDGVDFYPMVWREPASASGPSRDVYSVLVSPCGKQLVEVAALNNGNRPRDAFYEMSIPRAVFDNWNEPVDPVVQPLMPLRMSRAVPPDRLDSMLDFYGAGSRSEDSATLGFGQSRILADVTDEEGTRAVTLMLSPLATVHLQLWARAEEEPSAGPDFPSEGDFEAAAASNQVNGGQPATAQDFCSHGTWTVKRYSDYLLQVHETVMTPVPVASSNPLTPPVGNIMDVFLDDHISWDCTSPHCDMAAGGQALYNFGSRIQWVSTGDKGGNWTPYSYDPAGYGVQLHWYFAADGFAPEGPVYPECFQAYANNRTCPRSVETFPVSRCHIDRHTGRSVVVSDVFNCSVNFQGTCTDCRAIDAKATGGGQHVSCLAGDGDWYSARCPGGMFVV